MSDLNNNQKELEDFRNFIQARANKIKAEYKNWTKKEKDIFDMYKKHWETNFCE